MFDYLDYGLTYEDDLKEYLGEEKLNAFLLHPEVDIRVDKDFWDSLSRNAPNKDLFYNFKGVIFEEGFYVSLEAYTKYNNERYYQGMLLIEIDAKEYKNLLPWMEKVFKTATKIEIEKALKVKEEEYKELVWKTLIGIKS